MNTPPEPIDPQEAVKTVEYLRHQHEKHGYLTCLFTEHELRVMLAALPGSIDAFSPEFGEMTGDQFLAHVREVKLQRSRLKRYLNTMLMQVERQKAGETHEAQA
jgi:hypothetical protein